MHDALRSVTVFLLVLTLAGCTATLPSGSEAGDSMASRLSRSTHPEIKAAIDRFLPDSLFPPASMGIRVVSVRSGEPIYDLHPDFLFTPASTQKLLTTATALALLGPAFRFETVLHVDSTSEPTMTISGAGDPLLTTADIDSIAFLLPPLLSPQPAWTLVGDVSAFDDEPWGKGWMWDDEPDPTAMEISPLSVNRNCVTVSVQPGRSAGDALQVTVEPATDFMSVVNEGVSTSDSVRSPLVVTRPRRGDVNIIHVSGEMRTDDSAITRRVSVRDPARYFLTLLAERLRSQGVPVARVRIDTIPAAGTPIVVRTRTLDSVITFMNTWSDNLAAECILKTLDRQATGRRGSSQEGTRAMRGILQSLGVDSSAVVAADGSGLSRYNLLSARALTDLLVCVARDTVLFHLIRHSLPVAGRSGTLLRRMRGTAAEGNVRAKTGTMTGGSSLAGYALTADGDLVAFAILMQNYPGEAGPYRVVQDSLAAILRTVRR